MLLLKCTYGQARISPFSHKTYTIFTCFDFEGGVRRGPGIPNIPVSNGQYPNIPNSKDQYPNIPFSKDQYPNFFMANIPISKIAHGYPNIPISERQYPNILEKTTNVPISQIGLTPPYFDCFAEKFICPKQPWPPCKVQQCVKHLSLT